MVTTTATTRLTTANNDGCDNTATMMTTMAGTLPQPRAHTIFHQLLHLKEPAIAGLLRCRSWKAMMWLWQHKEVRCEPRDGRRGAMQEVRRDVGGEA